MADNFEDFGSEAKLSIALCCARYKPATQRALELLFEPETAEDKTCAHIKNRVDQLRAKRVEFKEDIFNLIEKAILYRERAASLYTGIAATDTDASANQGHRAFVGLLRYIQRNLFRQNQDSNDSRVLDLQNLVIERPVSTEVRGTMASGRRVPSVERVASDTQAKAQELDKEHESTVRSEDAFEKVDMTMTPWEIDPLGMTFDLFAAASDVLEHLEGLTEKLFRGELGMTTYTAVLLHAYEILKAKSHAARYAFELNGWGDFELRETEIVQRVLVDFQSIGEAVVVLDLLKCIKGVPKSAYHTASDRETELVKAALNWPAECDKSHVRQFFGQYPKSKEWLEDIKRRSRRICVDAETVEGLLSRATDHGAGKFRATPFLEDLLEYLQNTNRKDNELALIFGIAIHVRLSGDGKLDSADPRVPAIQAGLMRPAVNDPPRSGQYFLTATQGTDSKLYDEPYGWRKTPQIELPTLSETIPDAVTMGLRLVQYAVANLDSLHTSCADAIRSGEFAMVPGLLLVVDFLRLKGATAAISTVDHLMDLWRSIVYPRGECPNRLDSLSAFHAYIVRRRGTEKAIKRDFNQQRLQDSGHCLLSILYKNNFRLLKEHWGALGYSQRNDEISTAELTIGMLKTLEESLTKQMMLNYNAGKVLCAISAAFRELPRELWCFVRVKPTLRSLPEMAQDECQKYLDSIYKSLESFLQSEYLENKASDPRFYFVDLKQEASWRQLAIQLASTCSTRGGLNKSSNLPNDIEKSMAEMVVETFKRHVPTDKRLQLLKEVERRLGLGEGCTAAHNGYIRVFTWKWENGKMTDTRDLWHLEGESFDFIHDHTDMLLCISAT